MREISNRKGCLSVVIIFFLLLSYYSPMAKADKSGKVLGKVQAGDTITVSSIEGGWAAIDFKGKTAYVSKDYITEAK